MPSRGDSNALGDEKRCGIRFKQDKDGLQFHLLPSDLPSQNLNLFTYKLGLKKFLTQKAVMRIK